MGVRVGCSGRYMSDEVRGDWRRLRNEGLYALCSNQEG